MADENRMTAEQARDLVAQIRHKEYLKERQGLEAYIDAEIVAAAKDGDYIVDIHKFCVLNATSYQAVCQDLEDRGFQVLSDTVIGEDGLIDEADLRITWFPKPARGEKKK